MENKSTLKMVPRKLHILYKYFPWSLTWQLLSYFIQGLCDQIHKKQKSWSSVCGWQKSRELEEHRRIWASLTAQTDKWPARCLQTYYFLLFLIFCHLFFLCFCQYSKDHTETSHLSSHNGFCSNCSEGNRNICQYRDAFVITQFTYLHKLQIKWHPNNILPVLFCQCHVSKCRYCYYSSSNIVWKC